MRAHASPLGRYRREIEERDKKRRERQLESETADRIDRERRDLLEQIEIEDRKERYERQRQRETEAIGSLLQGPPIGSKSAGEEDISPVGLDQPAPPPPPPPTESVRHSFAIVTQVFASPRTPSLLCPGQMGGNFPSLGDSVKQQQRPQTQPQRLPSTQKTCWGGVPTPSDKNSPQPALVPSPQSASKKFSRKKVAMVPLDLGLFSDPKTKSSNR